MVLHSTGCGRVGHRRHQTHKGGPPRWAPLLFLWLGEVVLELAGDPVALCAALVDVPSVSGDEAGLADLVETALREQAPHLEVLRTRRRRAGPHPARAGAAGAARRPPRHGAGGRQPAEPPRRRSAVRLRHVRHEGAATPSSRTSPRPSPSRAHDLTSCSTTARRWRPTRNGLGRVEREHRDWLDADLALLGEPTNGAMEAGCQGTLRVEVTHAGGGRTRPGRGWARTPSTPQATCWSGCGVPAAREVEIDGCVYREGLQAVGIAGGVAGNVVPDECGVTVNFRFAPDRDVAAAEQHVREVFDGLDVVGHRLRTPGPLPGLAAAAARSSSRRRARRGREVRLDRRRPVRRVGHPRGELRPRRPQPRAHPGGARRRAAHRRRRTPCCADS